MADSKSTKKPGLGSLLGAAPGSAAPVQPAPAAPPPVPQVNPFQEIAAAAQVAAPPVVPPGSPVHSPILASVQASTLPSRMPDAERSHDSGVGMRNVNSLTSLQVDDDMLKELRAAMRERQLVADTFRFGSERGWVNEVHELLEEVDKGRMSKNAIVRLALAVLRADYERKHDDSILMRVFDML